MEQTMTNRERAVEIMGDRTATTGDVVWAVAQLLRTIPRIDVDGVIVNSSRALTYLEDAACILDRPAPRPATTTEPVRRTGRSLTRWNFG